jgi:predicted glutamine amidotransferase
MCGIHGMFNGKVKALNVADFISNGFVAGSVRGMDSSGIAIIDTKNNYLETHKLAISGSVFVTDRVAKKYIEEARDPHVISICHTRAATSGGLGYSAAHPFYIESADDTSYREMVGVHNGSLTNWATKDKAKNYSVDSEWALNHIYDKGAEAFKDFTGAYCFVWWDSDEDDVLNIARNDTREMHVAMLENGGLAYASEAGMLYWLLERNSLKIKGTIIQLDDHTHYKFKRDDLHNFTKEKLLQPPTPTTTYNYHGTSTRPTVVQQMDALLAKIAGSPEAAASNVSTGPKVPFVSRAEVENATMLELQGQRGTFTVLFYDQKAEELLGTFSQGATEYSAVMRNALGVKWNDETPLDVSILGVIDDGTEITVVTSKPRVVAKQATPLSMV